MCKDTRDNSGVPTDPWSGIHAVEDLAVLHGRAIGRDGLLGNLEVVLRVRGRRSGKRAARGRMIAPILTDGATRGGCGFVLAYLPSGPCRRGPRPGPRSWCRRPCTRRLCSSSASSCGSGTSSTTPSRPSAGSGSSAPRRGPPAGSSACRPRGTCRRPGRRAPCRRCGGARRRGRRDGSRACRSSIPGPGAGCRGRTVRTHPW